MLRKILMLTMVLALGACSGDDDQMDDPVGVEEESSFSTPEVPAVPETNPLELENDQARDDSGAAPLYVRCAYLYIRTGPGKRFKTDGYLKFNDQVTPLETTAKWVRIGESRWVGRRFLSDHRNERQYIPGAH